MLQDRSYGHPSKHCLNLGQKSVDDNKDEAPAMLVTAPAGENRHRIFVTPSGILENFA